MAGTLSLEMGARCLGSISVNGRLYYLEAQGSYNQALAILVTHLQPGQVYLRGLEVVHNYAYGLVIIPLDLQVLHYHIPMVLHVKPCRMSVINRRKRASAAHHQAKARLMDFRLQTTDGNRLTCPQLARDLLFRILEPLRAI